MECFITVMPSQVVLEWYLSGRGKDGRGVAVRLNTETHRLEPDSNFVERVIQWVEDPYSALDDPYRLAQMPDTRLLNAYLSGKAHLNLSTRQLELKITPAA